MLPINKLVTAQYQDVLVIGIDPGETTGICLFDGPKLLLAGQLKTVPLGDGITAIGDWFATNVLPLMESGRKCVCSFEDYRVYDWKANTHKWADLHTPKLIGAIVCLMMQFEIPAYTQMAGNVKPFFTDEKLKSWGLYSRAQRHARDAVRHALYRMVFGKEKLA